MRTSKSKRKPPVVSRPIGKTDATLPTLLAGQETQEREPKTIEVIDDAAVFYLVVPCERGKPDKIQPLYLVETNSLGGPERGCYQCQECTGIFASRRSWEKHKGINWIHASRIEVCK